MSPSAGTPPAPPGRAGSSRTARGPGRGSPQRHGSQSQISLREMGINDLVSVFALGRAITANQRLVLQGFMQITVWYENELPW